MAKSSGWKQKCVHFINRAELYKNVLRWQVVTKQIAKSEKRLEAIAVEAGSTEARGVRLIRTLDQLQLRLNAAETALYQDLYLISDGLLKWRESKGKVNHLYHLPMNEDDIINHMVAKFFENSLPIFFSDPNKSRTQKGREQHCYIFVERGLFNTMRSVIGRDRKLIDSRGFNTIPFSAMTKSGETPEDLKFESVSANIQHTNRLFKMDFFRNLEKNMDKLWPSCRKIAKRLLETRDITVLLSNEDFVTEFGYSRQVKKVFLVRLKEFCCSQLI